MEGKTYGYIRVSSRDQNEDRQRIAMQEFGVDRQNTFFDKRSGKDFDRPKYKCLLKKLKPGAMEDYNKRKEGVYRCFRYAIVGYSAG